MVIAARASGIFSNALLDFDYFVHYSNLPNNTTSRLGPLCDVTLDPPLGSQYCRARRGVTSGLHMLPVKTSPSGLGGPFVCGDRLLRENNTSDSVLDATRSLNTTPHRGFSAIWRCALTASCRCTCGRRTLYSHVDLPVPA